MVILQLDLDLHQYPEGRIIAYASIHGMTRILSERDISENVPIAREKTRPPKVLTL
jgi:hypothetical protein